MVTVATDTQFHARQAADKVKVDYEVLPPLTDPFEALKPGATQVHAPGNMYEHGNLIDTTAFSRGDVEAAFATAPHVIEETFRTQPIEPAFLEPEACLALPQGKGVKVHAESQGSAYDQQQIAEFCQMCRWRKWRSRSSRAADPDLARKKSFFPFKGR